MSSPAWAPISYRNPPRPRPRRVARRVLSIRPKVSASARPQSVGEELANTISHGMALLAAVVGLPPLVLHAAREGTVISVLGATVFGLTAVLVFFASTMYHALPEGRVKERFLSLDYTAIFLLIAGTYTPFTLGPLWGPWGLGLLVAVWALATVGVGMTLTRGKPQPKMMLILCLTMGWIGMIAVGPAVSQMPRECIFWIVAGGLFYTAGVAFWLLSNYVQYTHFVWHIFVIVGAALHYHAVMWHVV